MNALTSSGAINTTTRTSNGRGYTDSVAEAFVAPGAPRALWIGARWEFGGRKSSGSSDKD